MLRMELHPSCEEKTMSGETLYQPMGTQQPLYPVKYCWDQLADGEPPIWNLKDIRLPGPILRKLTATGILPLTPIQLYALRLALSANHMVATSFTGPGKTLVIALSLIIVALRQLSIMSSNDEGGQGAYCLLICPSNENALKTYQVVEQHIVPLKERNEFPELRTLLCIDDDVNLKKGMHIVVSTPGRLKFALGDKSMNLANCTYLVLDEAEILFENSSFRDDVQQVLGYIKGGCQTAVFPAYRTAEVDRFIDEALRAHGSVCAGVDVSRLHVIQQVEYVKQEEKIFHIVHSLRETVPPVLVICDHMNDVESLEVYLTEKGYKPAAIHAGKDPEERADAISSFESGKHYVMVATDATLDELDFLEIQHVINYDMPSAIDKYLRRIAPAGRKFRPGKAITYVNKNQPVETLVQLKLLLQETNHPINRMLEDLIHGIEPVSDTNADHLFSEALDPFPVLYD